MRVIIGILVAGGLVGLLAWLAAPRLIRAGSERPAMASTSARIPATSTGSTAALGEARGGTPRPAPLRAESSDTPSKPAPSSRKSIAAPGYYAIVVSTLPSGATARLDELSGSCDTPCLLTASPGAHTVTISRKSYETEYRQVDVHSDSELPVITLRADRGFLMVASLPAGARIFIDGRDSDQVTPAEVQIDSGAHQVTIEKDGKRTSEAVQVTNGVISYLRIPLER